VPPFQLGQPMDGGAVGVVRQLDGDVVDSTGRTVKEGDTVLHGQGWRTHAVLPGKALRVVDTDVAPAGAWLGVLGMTGLTAYAGLLRVAAFKEGDVVFVSAAAGSVGSLVGQIAHLKGASLVVGSAGGPEKSRWLLDDLGFDRAIDYKAVPIAEGLREAAPDGIDVYFDNVGGEHLEAAIGSLGVHGRAVICGMISAYNATEPPAAPRNLAMVIGKRLRLEGMLVSDHDALRPEFEREVTAMLADGRVKTAETVVEGLDHAAEAFIGLLRGENTGKMVVRL